MFSVVTTLVEHEPKQFNGSNGPWTLHLFKAADGTRFQTSKTQIANQAFALLNQQVTLTYKHEQRGEYTNNVIESVASGAVAGAQAAPAAPTGAPTTAAAAPSGATPQQRADEGRAKEIRIMRQSALQRAIDAKAAGIVEVASMGDLIAVSEGFVKYFAGGPQAGNQGSPALQQATTAPTPPGDGGGEQGAAPVAPPAPAPAATAPAGPTDDIPF